MLIVAALLAAPADPLADEYARAVRPLVTKYCGRCHSEKQPEGDLDLTKFATREDVRKDARAWQQVGEMIDGGQMPPKDAKQPSADERSTLQSWVRSHLKQEAAAHAGDPGRVTLRRLSNAEYTYTLRDITGVPTLDPAKEFPADGAAGEGFTNTGDALVMSPALLGKYLDAGKRVAAHAVLLPDGIRFSPATTRRDWTTERLDRIRAIYAKYSDPGGGSMVSLQGLVWDGKEGGRLPVEKYLSATIEERAAIRNGKPLAAVAAGRGLSEKYLTAVWRAFTNTAVSPPLDGLRAKWERATPADVPGLAAEVGGWQNALWRFRPVGHIGKVGGPTAWMEPVDPVTDRHEVRWKLPPTDWIEQTLYLSAAGAGEAVWHRPRFVAPGQPDLLLKDLPAVAGERATRRAEAFAATTKYLAAVEEAMAGPVEIPALAKKHALNADVLAGWLTVLGVGSSGPVKLTGHFDTKIGNAGGYPFVNGWGSGETPLVLANSSDRLVRIPGDAKPHGVVVHPSPKLAVAVGWQSPVVGNAKVSATVQHAHTGCGNGVTWAVEVRRGHTRERLAAGISHGSKPVPVGPFENVRVSAGDVVSVLVGPRDGNHSCDLTAVDVTVTVNGKTWDLAKDVTPDILAGNPNGAWHFTTEPDGGAVAETLPPDSPLGKWRAAGADRAKRAADVRKWLLTPSTDPLHQRLRSLSGPLFGRLVAGPKMTSKWGLDPVRFVGDDLRVKAHEELDMAVPTDLVAGAEFVATGTVVGDGAVQLRIGSTPGEKAIAPGTPILAGGTAKERMAAGLAAVRDLFPPAVCYAKIVPVDEVVTLTLHHREDGHLGRLMLTDAERAELDRLWDELRYVSQDALAQVNAYNQLMEYATQDADPRVFEPLRKPTLERAAAFRKRLVETEPAHRTAVKAFAAKAYRRPLTSTEAGELDGLYARLRTEGLPHDEAIRLTIARVLVSPAFLYKPESPGPAAAAVPVTGWELATRLSYFLWSSAPDDELRAVAQSGKLRDPAVLAAQTRRMLADPKVRRLATEFGCQWLHVRGFDALNEKSERHFPQFAGLRADMYEESVLFFTDFFQQNRPVRSLLDSDATFVNEALAKHYGLPGVTGDRWRRVEGVRRHGRGGIFGLATTLTANAGASRTSPTLRGNWVSEVLLGEKLPKPPKGVPQLPEDEAATDKLTVRQLVERNASDPKCAVCHARIDAYGFALEGYDPIGRFRAKDLAGRPVDTTATALDGSTFAGLDGLRDYLLTKRRDAFERQFSRKLLGYALGRAVQLSDEPLLDEMRAVLNNDGRVGAAVEVVVRSRPFREIRGRQVE